MVVIATPSLLFTDFWRHTRDCGDRQNLRELGITAGNHKVEVMTACLGAAALPKLEVLCVNGLLSAQAPCLGALSPTVIGHSSIDINEKTRKAGYAWPPNLRCACACGCVCAGACGVSQHQALSV